MFSFISDSTRAFSIIASDAWLFLAFAQKVEIFETKKSFYFCCVLYKWLCLSFFLGQSHKTAAHSLIHKHAHSTRESGDNWENLCIF